jgi:hypothetical protein
MAYIGVQPRLGNFQACDAITTSATTTFNLLVGGTAIFPQSAQHCLVSLNGVLQAPISSYTISGSTIIFAAALTTDDSIDFITILGDTLDLGTPSDSTVTTVKIVDANVTAAKMFSGFANGITEADQWRITADHSGTGDITANWERVDSDGFNYIGTGMTESSGIFTFPSTGIWLIMFNASGYANNGASRYIRGSIETTLNGGGDGYSRAANGYMSSSESAAYNHISTNFIFDVTNTSQLLVKFSLSQNQANTPIFHGNTKENYTFATFIRLGDT